MERLSIDNFLPKEIALKAENIGVKKGNLDFFSMLILGILAGAYISTGAALYTIVISGNGYGGAVNLPFGIIKLIGGIAFSTGLILIVIAGAELFTGNVLVGMATASRKLPVHKLLYSWFVVYIGNFIGSFITAYLVFLTGNHMLLDGIVGMNALLIANSKCQLGFMTALTRGIFCNMLVCVAVWLTLSGRSITDKILAIIFPITTFVALGLEHCVANMYFVSVGIFINNSAEDSFWNMIGSHIKDLSALSWENFVMVNLLPVTLGNIIGGFIVGMGYWLIYCRPNIMDSNNEQALKKLIKTGRRELERLNVSGAVSLHVDSRVITGKIKDISVTGVAGLFNAVESSFDSNESLSIDLESYDGRLGVSDLKGEVVRKQVIDRRTVEIAIKFEETDPKKKEEIDRLHKSDYG